MHPRLFPGVNLSVPRVGIDTKFNGMGEIMMNRTGIWTQAPWISIQVLFQLSYLAPYSILTGLTQWWEKNLFLPIMIYSNLKESIILVMFLMIDWSAQIYKYISPDKTNHWRKLLLHLHQEIYISFCFHDNFLMSCACISNLYIFYVIFKILYVSWSI